MQTRTTRQHPVLRALLVLALAFATAACGGGDDGAADEALIEDLSDGMGVSAEAAECIIDVLGADQAQLLADNLDAQEAPEGFDESALETAATECDIS